MAERPPGLQGALGVAVADLAGCARPCAPPLVEPAGVPTPSLARIVAEAPPAAIVLMGESLGSTRLFDAFSALEGPEGEPIRPAPPPTAAAPSRAAATRETGARRPAPLPPRKTRQRKEPVMSRILRRRLVAALALASVAAPAASLAQSALRPALPRPGAALVEAPVGLAADSPAAAAAAAETEAAREASAWLESLCGPADDTQHVERYDGAAGPGASPAGNVGFVARHEPAVVQLQWNEDLHRIYAGPNADPGNVTGQRWCSGALIAPDLVLTAGHCFHRSGDGWIRPSVRVGGRWSVVSEAELASRMHVNFGYQLPPSGDAPRPATAYPIAELVEYQRDDLDYAIVRLGAGADGRPAGDRFPVAAVAAGAPALATALMLIQHPNGDPKKVHGGPLDFANPARLYYGSLDTMGGSSGAPLMNPAGEVVGVHTHGGCTRGGAGHNSATSIDAILAASDIL
ncbi:trypsin-like serine peptidase [Albimonas pacifica]|uniref:V8-like Glu-specific endopeptidase n=1 Tax=Albimonas pacifica TaxID=1114924 RepID=A0A1I3BDH0_9RHOB|nr:trypsin-like peptidase domain-containing protein [Albimonas pacifica]SFH60355.1 V8-like Glu-specific endopeptidase [Albimonas pacifica]